MNRVIGYTRRVGRQIRHANTNNNALIKDATNLRHAQWDAEAVQMRRMREEQHIQLSLSEFLRESEAHVSYLRYESHNAKNGEEG